MKRFNSIFLYSLWVAAVVLTVGSDVLAADGGGGRASYDLALRWINFVVLAVLIFKFAKAPLLSFLSGQKEKLSREIEKKTEEKEAAEAEVKEILTALNEAETRFSGIKNRIVEQGEKRKKTLIEDGRDQSRQLIADAKKRAEGQILQAKQQLKFEIVDAAVDLAMQKLPSEITAEDNHRLLEQYLAGAVSK